MAGRGFAPKDPAQRRNTAKPARGEWMDVPAFHDGPVPKMPARRRGEGVWPKSVQRAWTAWWQDGASTLWSSADVDAVIVCARLLEAIEAGELKYAAELRLRMDGLGLSPKGKRDLRLRVVHETPVLESVAPVEALDDRRARRRAELAGGA